MYIPFNLKMMIIFLIAFASTFVLAKFYIRKARQQGYVVQDMYKRGKHFVPTMGGLVILAGTFISLVAAQFFSINMIPLMIFYFIIFVYGMYGLTDDLFKFKQRIYKVWILFFLALPIALLTSDTNLSLLFVSVELRAAYAFVFAPLYIMIVANLVNMHSGYNGLSAGLSVVIMIFAGIKAYLTTGAEDVFILLPIFGATLAFLAYNMYPSRVFLGNVGSFMIGAAIGGFFVLANMEMFGVIILIPHIINLLMWIYWVVKKIPHAKFGKLRQDGTIEAPNSLTIKYLVTRIFKVTEPEAVWICYAITAMFGVIGLVVV